jgi:type IV secretion system protein VirB10
MTGQSASNSGEEAILPVVAKAGSPIPLGLLVVVLAALAIILFVVLEARRSERSAPAVHSPSGTALARSENLPPLYIPPLPQEPPPVIRPALASIVQRPLRVAAAPSAAPAHIVAYAPQPAYSAPPQAAPAQPVRTSAEPVIVIDTTGGPTPDERAEAPRLSDGGGTIPSVVGARAAAGVLANRATTIPQGSVIAAVLETALDSTRPGLARAIVSRDVRGFDGSRVLIPRGSRLIGEYGAEAKPGQRRMLVSWTRLIRPDGVTIAIGSAASDPLGRGGIRAHVNNHFFQRFAGAILQSALDIGVNLASRSLDSPVVVAVPGALQQRSGETAPSQISPTLQVRPATSISIMAARDLDFTSVEASRGARR